jgi:hypothetical protein
MKEIHSYTFDVGDRHPASYAKYEDDKARKSLGNMIFGELMRNNGGPLIIKVTTGIDTIRDMPMMDDSGNPNLALAGPGFQRHWYRVECDTVDVIEKYTVAPETGSVEWVNIATTRSLVREIGYRTKVQLRNTWRRWRS